MSARDTNEKYDWARLDAKTISRLLETIHLALEETPEVNRHLLLYLLDLLQACIRHSNDNLMTSDRLVAVFQPSLLSLQSDEMSIEEHQIAHQVIVLMIDILDEGRLRIDHLKKAAPSSAETAPTSTDGAPSIDIFRTFRAGLDDPCYKVLPAALREYNI
jgi:hypothetical protein